MASHPEDWQHKGVADIKPTRLLSISKDIDYGIYENKVVKKLIDGILSFLWHQRTLLKAKEEQIQQLDAAANPDIGAKSIFGWDLAFNTAMGELFNFTGFRDTDKEAFVSAYLEQIQGLLRKYRLLRKSVLYKKAGNTKQIHGNLYITNLLFFHKQYRAARILWNKLKDFSQHTPLIQGAPLADPNVAPAYRNYCYATSVYVLSKLGFVQPQPGAPWERPGQLQVTVRPGPDETWQFVFHDIRPRRVFYTDVRGKPAAVILPRQDTEAFVQRLLQENKHNRYTPNLHGLIYRARQEPRKSLVVELRPFPWKVNKNISQIRQALRAAASSADFTLTALPLLGEGEKTLTSYASADGKRGIIPLSLFDINSYRRLQKVFLRVIMGFEQEFCPVCGGALGAEKENTRVCQVCALQLIHTECKKGHAYSYLTYPVSKSYRPFCPYCGDSAHLQEEGGRIRCLTCSSWFVQTNRMDFSPSVYANYQPHSGEETDTAGQWLSEDAAFRYIDVVPLRIVKNVEEVRVYPTCPVCQEK